MSEFAVRLFREGSGELAIRYQPERGLFEPADGVLPSVPGEMLKLFEAQKLERAYFLRIFTGYDCNMRCAYCIQEEGMSHARDRGGLLTDRPDPESLISSLVWFGGKLGGHPLRINFMGGEPLLHWDELRFMVDGLRARMPETSFSLISNGTLMDGAKARYIMDRGIHVTLSHDGPGQGLRGLDPLRPGSESGAALRWIHRAAPHLLSVSSVLSKTNHHMGAVLEYLERRLHGPVFLADAAPCMMSGLKDARRFSVQGDGLIEMRQSSIEAMFERDMSFLPRFTDMLGLLYQVLFKGRQPGAMCGAYDDLPRTLDRKGNVLRCPSCPGDFFPGTKVANYWGNMRNWHERDASLDEIRNEGRAGGLLPSPHTRESCRNCPFVLLCAAACPAMEEESFALRCAQKKAQCEAVFAAFLKMLYPDMAGFSIERR